MCRRNIIINNSNNNNNNQTTSTTTTTATEKLHQIAISNRNGFSLFFTLIRYVVCSTSHSNSWRAPFFTRALFKRDSWRAQFLRGHRSDATADARNFAGPVHTTTALDADCVTKRWQMASRDQRAVYKLYHGLASWYDASSASVWTLLEAKAQWKPNNPGTASAVGRPTTLTLMIVERPERPKMHQILKCIPPFKLSIVHSS